MQVASTRTGEPATAGGRAGLRGTLNTALNRPVVPGLIALAAAVLVVGARLAFKAHGGITDLMLVGNVYGHPGQLPAGVHVFHYAGYDGQFYYRMALDPADLNTTGHGITMDFAYRFVRIGYSALAWLLALGHSAAVPYTLVLINIAALGVIGLLGGILAREAGRHALWGLLLAGYFGFVTSLSRDLTELLGAVCLLGGILALRRAHPLVAAALFAYGSLTRETVLVAPAAFGLIRVIAFARRRARPGWDDLAWIVPGIVFAAWETVLKKATGGFPILSDGSKNAGLPLSAGLHAIAHNFAHPLAPVPGAPGAVIIWDLEFLVLVCFAVTALLSLRSTTVPVYERLALVLYVVEIFCLAPTNWDGYADLRSFVEVYLLAVLILLAAPRRLGHLALLAMGVAPLFVTVAVYRAQIW